MIVKFRDVEPYNNTGRDPADAKKLIARIPPNSTFEFNGTTKPKCMLLDVITYNESSGLNTAGGLLLSIDLDTYFNKLDAGTRHSQLIDQYGIGTIQINYRAEHNPAVVEVEAYAFDPAEDDTSQSLNPPTIPASSSTGKKPVAGQAEIKTGDGICPFCNEALDRSTAKPDWICPVCQVPQPGWFDLLYCHNCGFGNRILECPHCGEDYDTRRHYLSLERGHFDYLGFLKYHGPTSEYRIGDLKIFTRDTIDPDIASCGVMPDPFFTIIKNSNLENHMCSTMSEELLQAIRPYLVDVEFRFPGPANALRAIQFYNCAMDETEKYWYSAYLFDQEKTIQVSSDVGQIVFTFDSKTGLQRHSVVDVNRGFLKKHNVLEFAKTKKINDRAERNPAVVEVQAYAFNPASVDTSQSLEPQVFTAVSSIGKKSVAGQAEIETEEGICPFCNKALNLKIVRQDWICPVCEVPQPDWFDFEYCYNCGFGNRILECPHCGEDFDTRRHYLTLERGYFDYLGFVKYHGPTSEYRIGDLKIFTRDTSDPDITSCGVMPDTFFNIIKKCNSENQCSTMPDKLLQAIMPYLVDVTFRFPGPGNALAAIQFYNYSMDKTEKIWYSAYLFDQEKTIRVGADVGQLVLTFDSKTGLQLHSVVDVNRGFLKKHNVLEPAKIKAIPPAPPVIKTAPKAVPPTGPSFEHLNSRKLLVLLSSITNDKNIVDDLALKPYLDTAQTYLKAKQFDKAVQQCEVVLSINKTHTAAKEIKQKAETQKREDQERLQREEAERQKREKIRDAMLYAESTLGHGNFDKAIELCDMILSTLDSCHEGARELKEKTQQLKQEKQQKLIEAENQRRREEQLKLEAEKQKRADKLRQEAKQLRRQQIKWALIVVCIIIFLGAAKIYSDYQARMGKIEAALISGEKALAAEDFGYAQIECKIILSRDPDNTRAHELLMRVERKKAETIAALLKSAKSLLSGKEYTDALMQCNRLLVIDSTNTEALEIKSKAEPLKKADDIKKQKQEEAEAKARQLAEEKVRKNEEIKKQKQLETEAKAKQLAEEKEQENKQAEAQVQAQAKKLSEEMAKENKEAEAKNLAEEKIRQEHEKVKISSGGRFVFAQEGIFEDTVTGLQWAQNISITLPRYQAQGYAKQCRLGGYSNWRLPEKEELEGLITYAKKMGVKEYFNKFYQKLGFNGWKASCYWSDTSHWSGVKIISVREGNWYVNFSSGTSSYYYDRDQDQIEHYGVCLVRSGQ